jgi:hypothetical protein
MIARGQNDAILVKIAHFDVDIIRKQPHDSSMDGFWRIPKVILVMLSIIVPPAAVAAESETPSPSVKPHIDPNKTQQALLSVTEPPAAEVKPPVPVLDLHLDPYKFQPALDPLAITRLTPPSAVASDAQNAKSDPSGARLAPMLSDADRASGRPAFGIQLRSNF